MNREQKSVGLLAVALLLSAAASAERLYNSATVGSTGHRGGFAVTHAQFLGSRFTVPAGDTWLVDDVGGHLVSFQNIGNDMIFAAVIELAAGQIPPGPFFENSVVRGTATWIPGDLSDDFHVGLNLQLEPGGYALVFGSGLFGATGEALMPTGNMTGATDNPVGVGSYFIRDRQSAEWRNGGFDRVHFAVTGVPEPATLTLLGLGALTLLRRCR